MAELATEALTAAGVPHHLQTAGNLSRSSSAAAPPSRTSTTPAPSPPPPTPRSSTPCWTRRLPPPSPFEAWFLSAAHDASALARIAAALPAGAQAAAQSSPPKPEPQRPRRAASRARPSVPATSSARDIPPRQRPHPATSSISPPLHSPRRPHVMVATPRPLTSNVPALPARRHRPATPPHPSGPTRRDAPRPAWPHRDASHVASDTSATRLAPTTAQRAGRSAPTDNSP